jgi:tetratricopeptide (TPR) repeat protein
VQRGASELARQPAARAELFGVIARLRLGLGDYREALKLLDREAAIVVALDKDAPNALRIESASDRGRAQRLIGDQRQCIATMRPLQSLVERQQQQLPLQAADFYSQLGRCQRGVGARAAARSLFQRALALRHDPLGDAAGTAENLADLAGLDSDAGDSTQALQGYRVALSQLQANVGAQHPLAVELWRNLCAIEARAGDMVSAHRDCDQALTLALALHGPRHPDAIAAQRQLLALQPANVAMEQDVRTPLH